MILESLSRQRDSIDSVLRSYQNVVVSCKRLLETMQKMPPDVQDDILHQLMQIPGMICVPIYDIERFVAAEAADAVKGVDIDGTLLLPGPRQAIIAVLEENPHGLHLNEIVEKTRGRFKTNSTNPGHIVRTTIGQMREKADILKAEDGRHTLSPFYGP